MYKYHSNFISGYDTDEFYIVREHSKRKAEDDSGPSSVGKLKNQISLLEANMYKEYQDVYIYSKVRTKIQVVLCVSEDKLEIYPKQIVSSAKFWQRQKSFSYHMDGIVACDIVDKKPNGQWVFKLVFHSDHGYKRHEFECVDIAANEIQSKINHLLNWRHSEARKEYLAYKEKRRSKHSWSFKW